jgi:diguanylate cyclase (GGDEF)-like protein/PAS domain S-box-containing protein
MNRVLNRLPFRAAAFMALICAAIVGLSGTRELASRATRLKAAEVEMSNLARSVTQHAEDSFELLDSSILGVVIRLETNGTSPETLAGLQKVLVARKATLKRSHGIVIVDENGDWLASSGAMGKNVSEREYFQHHLRSTAREVFVGPPVRSNANGEWVTTVSRRFNHPDGSFAGVALATIGANYFAEFYRQFDIGTHGAITLLNADGIVLARNPDNGTYVGRDISNGPLFRDPTLLSPRGIYYFKSPFDGMQRVSSYQRSALYPIVVLATMQQEEVLAPWRTAAIARMSIVLALAALIAFIGFFMVRQMQERQHMVVALEAKEANFRLLAEGSSDMVTRIGLDERVSYASPSAVRIVGWRADQLIGTPSLAGVNAEDLPRVDATVAALRRGNAEEARISYRTRHREKGEIWIESNLRVTRNVGGEVDGVVAISRDISEQKDLEKKLEALATVDGLTGLANRGHFDQRLQDEYARAFREGTPLSLLMIDVDHFKKFNDQYGHPAGDVCLQSVAKVLAAEARRPADLAARYGGEEFVLLLPNTDEAGCEPVGQRIRKELKALGIIHALNLPSQRVTVSLGGATIRPNARGSTESSSSLVAAADQGLYAAKESGRDRLVMIRKPTALFDTSAA